MKTMVLLVVLVASLSLYTGLVATWEPSYFSHASGKDLPSFGSYAELAQYLDAALHASGGPGFMTAGPPRGGASPPTAIPSTASDAYSTTNVQVSGVDELDTVKTDGTYLFVASAQSVVIIRANPPSNMAIVSRILIGGTPGPEASPGAGQVVGVFLEGGHLAVVSAKYGPGAYVGPSSPSMAPRSSIPQPVPLPDSQAVLVSVYDVTQIEEPRLLQSLSISGYPLTARMTKGFVYVIAGDYIQKMGIVYRLPTTCEGTLCSSLDLGSIHYDPQSRQASSFTNILAVDLRTGEHKTTSVITGPASVVYMSPSALYLAFPKWGGDAVMVGRPGVVRPPVGSSAGASTTLYKLLAEGASLQVVSRGDVMGTLLNQFSMDEYGGYLRVATWGQVESVATNVYVLNGELAPMGALEGLAPGESMHSARFVGDRAYLVTFKKIDPLFVVDLSEPRKPKVLGTLKVPGFSEYMHPLGKDLILGVGKDTVEAEQGNFAWYQGLKLSLFDVADVLHPRELAKYVIGDRGTSSDVLYDHKAFLNVPSRGLVVIPVDLAKVDPTRYGKGGVPPNAYGEIVWQGAYVLAVDPQGGIVLKGRITHFDGTTAPFYRGYPYAIHRSLYIGDNLYTISPTKIKVNALGDLSEVASLTYGSAVQPPGIRPG